MLVNLELMTGHGKSDIGPDMIWEPMHAIGSNGILCALQFIQRGLKKGQILNNWLTEKCLYLKILWMNNPLVPQPAMLLSHRSCATDPAHLARRLISRWGRTSKRLGFQIRRECWVLPGE